MDTYTDREAVRFLEKCKSSISVEDILRDFYRDARLEVIYQRSLPLLPGAGRIMHIVGNFSTVQLVSTVDSRILK
jgi:hypothetical protein